MALEEVLAEFEITGLDEAEKTEVNFFWHRLRPWARLRTRPLPAQAPLHTRAHVQRQHCADDQHGQERRPAWDCILGAEVARHYKPDPESYLTAVSLLGLTPERVMMTAAHQGDLLSAQKVGLRAGFCAPADGTRPRRDAGSQPRPVFDVVAADFVDLARQMGV